MFKSGCATEAFTASRRTTAFHPDIKTMQGTTRLRQAVAHWWRERRLNGARVHIHDVLTDPEYTWAEGRHNLPDFAPCLVCRCYGRKAASASWR